MPSVPHKKAYKPKFGYLNDNAYLLFLKKLLLSATPIFLGVVAKCSISTPDGPMYLVHVVDNGIDDPSFEPIAQCIINQQYIYLWRNRCWGVAVDKYNRLAGNKIYKSNGTELTEPLLAPFNYHFRGKLNVGCWECTLILYEIGTHEVDYD